MRQNVAGQHIAVQMNSRTNGDPLTTGVSAFVTVNNGTQTAGGGTLTHKGNGAWNYAPTAAETNGNHVAFTFTHATGVHQTINVYPVAYNPYDATTLGLANLDAAITSRSSAAALATHDTDIKAQVLIRANTAQGGAVGSITLDASASAVTNFYAGQVVVLTGGTGVGQARVITAYNGTSKVATVADNWATTPTAGTAFSVLSLGRVNLTAWRLGVPNNLVASNVPSDLVTWVGTIPNALVAGNAPSHVNDLANGVISATKIAAAAITATQAPNLDAAITSRASSSELSTHDGDIKGRLPTTLVGGRIDASVGAYQVGQSPSDILLTDSTPFAGANIDAAISTRATPAQVKTQADAALSDLHLDHLLATATPTFPGNAGSILGEMLERITTWRFVIEALSQAPGGAGGGDWTTAELQQIRDALGVDGIKTPATGGQLQTKAAEANATTNRLILLDYIERLRAHHVGRGETFYVDPVNGNDTTGDGTRGLPWATIQKAHNDGVVTGRHDVIMLIAGGTTGQTILNERPVISKRYVMVRGPGRDFAVIPTSNGDTFTMSGEGSSLEGFQIRTHTAGNGAGVLVSADNVFLSELFIDQSRGAAIEVNGATWARIRDCNIQSAGTGGNGHGVSVLSGAQYTIIRGNRIIDVAEDGVNITSPSTDFTLVRENVISRSGGWGVNVQGGTGAVIESNALAGNSSGAINAGGTATVATNNEQWARRDGEYTAARAANLDNLDVAVSSRSATGAAMALTAAAVDAIHDDPYEGLETFRQAIRIIRAAASGVSTGGGTPNLAFRDAANGKDRIQATVDANGNRIAVTVDGT